MHVGAAPHHASRTSRKQQAAPAPRHPSGAFGVVRLAVHIRTGLRYAVKSVYKRQLRRRVDVEDLRREVQARAHPPHSISSFDCVRLSFLIGGGPAAPRCGQAQASLRNLSMS